MTMSAVEASQSGIETVSGLAPADAGAARSSLSACAIRAVFSRSCGACLIAAASAPAPVTASRIWAAGPNCSSIQARTTGSAATHMLILGSSERPTPSTTTMVFCRSSNSGRMRIWNRSVTSKSWVRSRAMEISAAGRPMIGSPMARSACAKAATSWFAGT